MEICNGVDDDCNGVIDNGVSCDDGNACTLDACKSSGCVNAPSGDGATCGSGKYCVANTCTTLSVPTGMALIPAATFWMGCNGTKDNNCQTDNLPQHKVTLSAYYMDLTETTVAQFKACVDAGICTQPNYVQPANFATYPGLTSNPVNFVSWTQARQYCTWRGTGYDLPTEAQSEIATRGSCEKNGSTASDVGCAWAMRSNPWGETAATCSYAIMWDSSGEGCGTVATWPVGSVTAGDSPYGLHDMAGNVREWNLDWHGPYTSDAQTDPAGPGTGTYRSVRDGSLGEGAINQRSANRSYSSGNPVWDIGLRCARSYP